MENFEDRLEILRESGIGLGLSDSQIDKCMVNGLLAAKRTLATGIKNNNREKPEKPDSTRANPRCRWLWKALRAIMIIFILLLILYQCCNYSMTMQRAVARNLEPIIYPMSRYWRLLTLPLARRFDLSSLYEDDCVIANPFSRPEEVPCDDYNINKEIFNVTKIKPDEYSREFLGNSKVLLVKGAHSRIPYTTLRTWHHKHKASLAHTKNYVATHMCGDVTILEEILEKYTSRDIKTWKNCHAEWVSNTVNPSRLLRQIFLRPTFIPKSSEVSITKTLILDSPNTPPYTLDPPVHSFPNLWYLQASGVRQLYLAPVSECAHKARAITVTLEPGDIVTFSSVFWRIDSAPVKESENSDVGVGFLGSFM